MVVVVGRGRKTRRRIGGMEGGPLQWYYEIPVVSRVYLTGSLLTTSLVALEVVSPYAFYFNWEDIMRGEVSLSGLLSERLSERAPPDTLLATTQIWRLVTDFLFFGSFSLDFLFHMYFLVRYCRLLEEGEFRGRTADFVFFLLFGAVLMTMVAPLLPLYFLGLSLTFMMVYVWGRRNEHVRLSFLGLFPFTAPYLPWVLLGFSLLLNNTSTLMTDIVGIAVGHIYYFLCFVYPKVQGQRRLQLQLKIILLLTVLFLPFKKNSGGRDPGLEHQAGFTHTRFASVYLRRA
jgi:Derlin-2/3